MQKLIKNILQQLYDYYRLHGHVRYNLNNYIDDMGFDPNHVANTMNNRGLLRQYQAGKGLIAVISEKGINIVDRSFFPDAAQLVLDHARANGNKTTVRNAVPNLTIDKPGVAKDIGNYIGSQRLANIQTYVEDVIVYF